MRVGFVVLNYQNYTATISCVDSLVTQLASRPDVSSYSWKIAVLDNNSPNKSWTELVAWLGCADPARRANIILLRNEANLGYGGGNNVGLRTLFDKEDCDIVFVVNSDVIAKHIRLEALESAASENRPTCLGVMLQETDRPKEVVVGGAYFRAPWFHSSRPATVNNATWGLFYVSGAFFGFNRALFAVTGGFNESHFLYFEELDLFFRVREVIGNWPDVKILKEWHAFHSVGGSTGNAPSGAHKSQLSEYYSARARILFARRHLLRLMANAIAYNVVLCVDRAARGRGRQLCGIIAGTVHGILGRTGETLSVH